ncbi:hypothetical protein [Pseudodesulfovibrio methanolicus]|uniref:Uncharacterized protein n=1 Tax=Pseudodesulfovibrio methanolicus TaxID=3126690 RepID=A0ABZ2J0L4_9BACT
MKDEGKGDGRMAEICSAARHLCEACGNTRISPTNDVFGVKRVTIANNKAIAPEFVLGAIAKLETESPYLPGPRCAAQIRLQYEGGAPTRRLGQSRSDQRSGQGRPRGKPSLRAVLRSSDGDRRQSGRLMTFDSDREPRGLCAKDVAALLGKSWVWDHAEAVGGVKRGGPWFFPSEEDI